MEVRFFLEETNFCQGVGYSRIAPLCVNLNRASGEGECLVVEV